MVVGLFFRITDPILKIITVTESYLIMIIYVFVNQVQEKRSGYDALLARADLTF